MQIAKKVQAGFTLIELMIVVAIIGILASIAIPQYEAFIQRSEFKVMETAVTPYKLGVEMCVQEQSTAANPLTGCFSTAAAPRLGRLGDIPRHTITGDRNDDVDTVVIVDGGIITASSIATAFGKTTPTTFILTPFIVGASTAGSAGTAIEWYFNNNPQTPPAAVVEGTCVADRLCR